MTWLHRYKIQLYLRNSLWIFPVLSMVAALGLVRLLHGVEERMGWQANITPETARAVMGTMAASMFTFVVFVSSALLVAVQLASAQLTPRVIAFVFRDPVTRWSLTLFVFTFTFCLATLIRIDTSVPLLTSHVAAYGSVVSLAVFLYLIDHVGHALRPSGALRSVARLGREVIEQVYPRRLVQRQPTLPGTPMDWGGKLTRTIASPWDGFLELFSIGRAVTGEPVGVIPSRYLIRLTNLHAKSHKTSACDDLSPQRAEDLSTALDQTDARNASRCFFPRLLYISRSKPASSPRSTADCG